MKGKGNQSEKEVARSPATPPATPPAVTFFLDRFVIFSWAASLYPPPAPGGSGRKKKNWLGREVLECDETNKCTQ